MKYFIVLLLAVASLWGYSQQPEDIFTPTTTPDKEGLKVEAFSPKGSYVLEYNAKGLGWSNYYGEVGSFRYFRSVHASPIDFVSLYRLNVLVQLKNKEIYYYNLNKRQWKKAEKRRLMRFSIYLDSIKK